MAIRSIVKLPNVSLRKPSVDVSADELQEKNLQAFIDDLKETMRSADGVGIAAPQVGVHQRIIIVNHAGKPQAYVNARIVSKSVRSVDSEEGCLSVPGVFGIVKRSRAVTVEALTREGKPVTLKLKGFPAIVFQHEIDHTNGILFIDKVVKYTVPPAL